MSEFPPQVSITPSEDEGSARLLNDRGIVAEFDPGFIEDFARKEAIVKQFINERGIPDKRFGLFRDQDSEAKFFQERITRQTEERGIVRWLKRLSFRNSLRAAGVQDPQRLVTFLDNNVAIGSYGDMPSKDVAGLLKTLDPDEEVALNKFNLGLSRLGKLNRFPHSYDFKDQNLSRAVVSLVNIPDETFQEVYRELDQYRFIYPHNVISSPDTQVLIEIFEQGGLSEKQRNRLEQEEIYSDLTGIIPIVEDRNSNLGKFSVLPGLADAINPKEDYLDEFYPYVIDRAYSSIQSSRTNHRQGEVYRSFIDGLDFLRESGNLPILQKLIQSGWSSADIYKEVEGIYGVFNKKVLGVLDRTIDFVQDSGKVAWVRKFQESLDGTSKLIPARVDVYEAMYGQRDKLDKLSAILQVLPNAKETRIFGGLIDVSNNGEIRINYNILSQSLVDLISNPDIPKKEKKYGYLFSQILYHFGLSDKDGYGRNIIIKEEHLPLLAFIATHKDWIGDLEQDYYSPNVKIVEGALASGVISNSEMEEVLVSLCSDPWNFPPNLAWKYLSFYPEERFQKTLNKLPDDFIKTLPVADQQVFYLAKNLDAEILDVVSTQAFLLSHRKQVADQLVDGKPTDGFFDLLVRNNLYDRTINSLITDEVMKFFTADEKQFWQTFKSYSVFRGARELLFKNRDKFGQFFVNGQPTAEFINLLTVDKSTQEVNQLLDLVNIESFPPSDLEYWSFYKSHPIMQVVLLRFRESFPSMVVNGKITPRFLEEIASKGFLNIVSEIFQNIDWDVYSEQKPFWEYYIKSPSQLRKFIYSNKDRFSEFVVDGNATPLFYQTLAQDDSLLFVQLATRDQWKLVLGEQPINRFLDSLPKRTDEKRNAFTHNDYDRTSSFINYMLSYTGEFSLNAQDISILTEYVREFGLSKTPVLFHFFKNLTLLQQQKIDQLPQDIEQSDLRTVAKMTEQLKSIRKIVYSESPMMDLDNLSPFEVEMLKFITGKSAHRFDYGKPSIEQIISDFQEDLTSGQIQGLVYGYQTETLNASGIQIEFDKEAIKEDYGILRDEILSSIQNPEDIAGLKLIIEDALKRKVEEIQRAIPVGEGKRLEFMTREIARFEDYNNKLSAITDLDSLMVNLLEMNFDKTEQRLINSVFRRIIFGKVFRKHYSPGFIEEIQHQLDGEISAGSIQSILNIVDEMAKTHVLNLEDGNKSGYWSNEAFAKIKSLKRGRDLPNSFSPHIGKLREEVGKFEKIQTGKSNNVLVVPDRGFVGEMSGYLADVCYTAEYPLLKKYPNVVPYKFISNNPDTGEAEFSGSVLVFELIDSNGNPSMLVRALNVPHENQIDIDSFIEQFLEKLADVGRKRGIKQILVPGNSGAVSNYQMTINHMRQNYSNGKQPVTLSEKFAFNGYDLTNDCYVARIIE